MLCSGLYKILSVRKKNFPYRFEIQEFKEKYKLDLVNTVFLTDGDSNDSESKFAAEGRINHLSKYGNDYNLVFRDPKTMLEGIKPPGAETTVGLLNLLKSMTGINVIGLLLFHGMIHNQMTVLIMQTKFLVILSVEL